MTVSNLWRSLTFRQSRLLVRTLLLIIMHEYIMLIARLFIYSNVKCKREQSIASVTQPRRPSLENSGLHFRF